MVCQKTSNNKRETREIVYSKVLCGKYNNRVGLKRSQRSNSDGLANIFESDNQFNKGFLSSRILRTNYVAHETHSEISIMRQATVLMHIWTNILNNKTASIYGGALHLVNDDLWDVIVPIRHTDRNIMRMESDEILISLQYCMEPC